MLDKSTTLLFPSKSPNTQQSKLWCSQEPWRQGHSFLRIVERCTRPLPGQPFPSQSCTLGQSLQNNFLADGRKVCESGAAVSGSGKDALWLSGRQPVGNAKHWTTGPDKARLQGAQLKHAAAAGLLPLARVQAQADQVHPVLCERLKVWD